MKILVSGGAGYIGSVVTHELLAREYEVVVLDNLYQGHRQAVDDRAVFIEADLADTTAVEAALAEHRPEGIMHFASFTLVAESMAEPFKYLRDNVINGMNLMESAVKYGVKRFILSSTANLFDDPEKMPIDENERIVPGSPYGESKFFLERALHWCDQIYGMRYAALRYFNACGDLPHIGEDHDPETHLIPLVLQVALGQRDKIMIFGDDYDTPDGTCIRDYVHVVDLATAHILALEALDRGSRRFNLGIGTGYSVKEVIETARVVTGHPIPAEVGPRRPGDPDVLVAGSESIRRELGWSPQYPDLQSIIASAWEWHSTHPHGYES
ncbi:MAG: UDP-glucose 4-epimerase GalE [Ardenticatenaceae bacterium]|nr:UDP-glucose 4-epimerase GalE [Ardenticatenaceae bacterium]